VITFKCAGFRHVNNDEAPDNRLKFESPQGDIPQRRGASYAACGYPATAWEITRGIDLTQAFLPHNLPKRNERATQ
jgi:hypothetical protein